MNILELAASISLDSTGLENGLSGITGKIKSVGSKIATAGAAISGAAAVGVTAITKMAVDGYADYEQLVGGVETLFGTGGKSIEEYAKDAGKSVSEVTAEYKALEGAQTTLMQNAANAFKTAGLSANDYMETATSFAASLVSSCGGDTQKAAEMADTAITDMADNANKMGTDMVSIQNAYQGFAKQNYTMLDNLKLGYGGTKEEMERLIEDANELEKAQGKAGDLTIDSYADIVTAIHDVQENMGVTGTTSKEAATTIQGSLAMTKSAWENLVTGMATDGADIKSLTGNLIESASAYADNLIPRITQAFQGLGSALTESAPELITKAGELVGQLLPGFVSGVANLTGAIISALPDLLKSIWDAIPTIVESVDFSSVASSVWSGISECFNGATDALSGINWSETAANLLDNFSQGVDDALNAGNDILQTVFGAGGTLLNKINEYVSSVDWSQVSIDISGMFSNIGDMASNALSGLGDAGNGLIDAVQGMFSNFDTSGLSETFWTTISSALQTGEEALTSLVEVGSSMITNLSEGFVDGIPDFLENALPMLVDFTSNLKENAGTLIDAGLDLIQNLAQGLIDSLPTLIENVPTIVQNIADIINENGPKIVATGLTIIANLIVGIIKAIPTLIKNIPKIISAILSVWNAFNWVSLGKTVVNGITKLIKNLPSTLKGLATKAVNSIKSAFTGGGIVGSIKGIFSKIPGAVSGLLTKAVNTVKGFPKKFISALKFEWHLPELKLPHISVSGGEAPFGIGGKGSLPSFHIEWAAKGGILDGATLVGAGEAGKEALLPLERNTGWMDTLADRISAKGDTVINVSMTVDGSDSPEEWGQRFVTELNRQVRMGVV